MCTKEEEMKLPENYWCTVALHSFNHTIYWIECKAVIILVWYFNKNIFLTSLYNIKLHLLNPSIFLLHIRSSISYCARKAGRDKRNWWQVTEKWKICDTRRASINELLQSWSKYLSPTAVAFCERLCAKCCCNCHMLGG